MIERPEQKGNADLKKARGAILAGAVALAGAIPTVAQATESEATYKPITEIVQIKNGPIEATEIQISPDAQAVMAKYNIRYSNGFLIVPGSNNLDLRGDKREGFNEKCDIAAENSTPLSTADSVIAKLVEVEAASDGSIQKQNTSWRLRFRHEPGGNARVIRINLTPREQK